ncbi:DUF2190 family protein [Citrobacter freundii]|nr:DUF2190 family protein [Citrobacter freundii]
MAKNYIEDGNTMDWTNDSGADVLSGSLVVIGDTCGVAAGDISKDAPGVLLMTGVFELTKSGTVTFLQGDKLFVVSGAISPVADNGATPPIPNPFAGTAWKDALAADAKCWVRLGF